MRRIRPYEGEIIRVKSYGKMKAIKYIKRLSYDSNKNKVRELWCVEPLHKEFPRRFMELTFNL